MHSLSKTLAVAPDMNPDTTVVCSDDDGSIDMDESIVFKGYDTLPHPLAVPLGHTREHGHLWGSPTALREWPRLENGYAQCGVCVVLIERGDDLFTVLYKCKATGRYMIPGGFLKYNETKQDGAARETRERTGLSVDSLSKLATMTYKTELSGLVIDGKTTAFYAVVPCPDRWRLPFSVNTVPHAGEDELVVVDVHLLEAVPNVFSIHQTLIEASLYHYQKTYSFLTSFNIDLV